MAYVEIIELQAATSSTELTAIPSPPARRSSMQDHKEEEEGPVCRVSETPTEASILEQPTSCTPEPPKVTVETAEEQEEGTEKKSSTDPQKSTVPIASGSVKTLTSKFGQAPSQQVLVQPHRKHTDLSPRKSYEPPQTSAAADTEVINRSSSASCATSSGRVTQITEQFKQKIPPPPTKPRPSSHVLTSPGADRGASSFQITPHSSTSGSPLQQAQLGSQLSPKTAASAKTTTPAKPRGSLVLRRDKSQKREDRPPLPSKPLTKPPPPKAPTELRAELQAVVGKRRPTD